MYVIIFNKDSLIRINSGQKSIRSIKSVKSVKSIRSIDPAGALSTAAWAAVKPCPKDTRNLTTLQPYGLYGPYGLRCVYVQLTGRMFLTIHHVMIRIR